MKGIDKCPIWGTAAICTPWRDGGLEVLSGRAGGKYTIAGTALSMLGNGSLRYDELFRAKLTTWLVDRMREGIVPQITSNTLDMVQGGSALLPEERAIRLLRLIRDRSKLLGAMVAVETGVGAINSDPAHPPAMAWTESTDPREICFLVDLLVERNWVRLASRSTGTDRIVVLPAGYAALATQDDAQKPASQAFVAMWFDSSMDIAWTEGIEPAIRDAGYSPLRIDRKDHINKIDDEIIMEIRRSRFLVADFTCEPGKPRGGVYFEAGFAMALRIPVIWTCREDRIDEVHFDTRQFNHLLWKTPSDLRRDLSRRVGRILGDGPHRKRP